MIIRKAAAADVDAIAQIYSKIHTAEEKGEVLIGWKRGVYPERATALAALERGDLFILESGGMPAGTAIINRLQVEVYSQGHWQYPADKSQVMVLHTLVIDPDRRDGGLGTAFVNYYERYALQNGCPYLRMDTNAKNKAARTLYKKLGYNEIGIVPCTFNGLEAVDLVLMEKCLCEDREQNNTQCEKNG